MFKHYIVILISIIILFSGCTSKNNIQKNTPSTISNNTAEESFDDEFSEENEEAIDSDPLEKINISMTNFNDTLYINILKPIAITYEDISNEQFRLSVRNFFNNILFPLRFVNNILQFKVKNALEETTRFTLNTTIGFFGFFDPAKKYYDINPHNEDFGQTLGYWGVGSGYHIVLPFFGPSNARDLVSFYPDSLLNPINYTKPTTTPILLNSYDTINNVSLNYKQYDLLRKDALQLYPVLKNVYEQRRNKLIKE